MTGIVDNCCSLGLAWYIVSVGRSFCNFYCRESNGIVLFLLLSNNYIPNHDRLQNPPAFSLPGGVIRCFKEVDSAKGMLIRFFARDEDGVEKLTEGLA